MITQKINNCLTFDISTFRGNLHAAFAQNLDALK